MLDISWTEFLLIAVVALIVIGPKELPAVLRTLGQWTRRVRSLAADFQSQFQEAMREAEMTDLKKQVDDMAQGIKNYDPLKDVRADIEAAGRDIQTSLEQTPALMTAAQPAAAEAAQEDSVAAATGPVAPEAIAQSGAEYPIPEPGPEPEGQFVAEAVAPAVPDEGEKTAQPQGSGQSQ